MRHARNRSTQGRSLVVVITLGLLAVASRRLWWNGGRSRHHVGAERPARTRHGIADGCLDARADRSARRRDATAGP